MIARHIEVNLKPEKLVEFKALYESEVLPLMKRQTGFLDSITLTPENVNDRSVTITLWRTKQDCENYHKKEFPRILEMVKPFLRDNPKIDYFNVEYTTFRKVDTVAA
ncbi:MAG TPA: antibiotic biosynthesis monooxygenase [Terriglobales bacterium]|nr:antibiotic biosynthesis monooxygenase [Terriglobales bacterium]